MRDTRRLHRQLGLRNAVVFHLVLTGQLISAFVFGPSLILLTLAVVGVFALFGDGNLQEDVVLIAALAAFTTGVLGALTLAVKVTARHRRVSLFDVLTMPIYWCAISIAAALALVELIVAPSRWNKTSHGHVARASDAPPPAS